MLSNLLSILEVNLLLVNSGKVICIKPESKNPRALGLVLEETYFLLTKVGKIWLQVEGLPTPIPSMLCIKELSVIFLQLSFSLDAILILDKLKEGNLSTKQSLDL